MKISTLGATITTLTTAMLLAPMVQADEIKGSAKADFAADELIVPCVAIEGHSAAADGTYFDLIFDRRGKSFNYELKFGEPEDPAVCEELANYAIFIDEDADDDEGEPEDDIFATCEVVVVEEEQTRSSISIQAKNLEAGDYYTVVTSGVNTMQSEDITTADDELETAFDSDEEAVGAGAIAIEAAFINDKEVTAEVVDAATDEVVLSETVSCIAS